MKILKLKMSAFSTYKDVVTIDFEHMIDHGIYLISGPTGSGKTTIFDAITFALYGKASGSERTQAYFRSDFASDQDETYVEMDFVLHNQEYHIKRTPTYFRKGYKTPKSAKAYLTYQDKTIEGVKEVDQKIVELLGVDVNQFKQIVMIAQGEFRKLIYASSEEREKVLRHIFHTESYVVLEQLLKDEVKKCKESYTLLSHQLVNEFAHLNVSEKLKNKTMIHLDDITLANEETNQLKKEHSLLKQEAKQLQLKYDQANKEYFEQENKNKMIISYNEAYQEYKQLLLEENSMLERKNIIDKLKIIQAHQPLIYQHAHLQTAYQQVTKEYDDLSYKLKQLLLKQEQIEQAYSKLPSLKEKQEQLQKEYTLLKDKYQYFNEYKDILKQYDITNKELLKLEKDYQLQQQDLEKRNNQLQRDQESIDQLPILRLELKALDQQEKEVNDRKIKLHELSDLYDRYKNLQDKHYELSQNYQRISLDYQTAYQSYQQEDELFKRQQAGILALTLQDNQPCPVCGSLHHPSIASLQEKVLTAHELDLLNQKVLKKQKLKEDAYLEVVNQNQKINDIKAQMHLLKQQLSIEEELSKEVFIRLLSVITNETLSHKEIYRKHNENVIYLQKLEKSHRSDMESYQKLSQQLDELLESKYELEKQQLSLKQQCLHFKQMFNNYDEESMLLKLNELSKDIQLLMKDIKDIEKNYVSYHEQYNSLLSQQKQAAHKQSSLLLEYQDIDKQMKDFKEKYFNNDFDYYQSLLPTLSIEEKIYQEYYMSLQKLKVKLDELKDIKDHRLIDLIPLKNALDSLKQELLSMNERVNRSQYIIDTNIKIIKKLNEHYQNNQELLEKYAIYQDLYDQTTGKNTKRMSFERYVLSHYFDQIIQYANIELLKMTQGRYELYRKVESKGSKQQGLDLTVLDYETGVMRDVQSLSGGESFKAALSLALGLSSMIQGYAGGIELNTLFIDEGFGSLDKESLDMAMNVLLDLKNDHKIIGIISHVDELKERIVTKINVHKGKQGSYLTIESD